MNDDLVVQTLARITTDFPYFCETVLKIRKKVRGEEESGERMRWKFNNVQQHLWEQLSDDSEILKMRAAGVSTYFQGITLWDAIRRRNTNCVEVVDRDDLSIDFLKTIREFVGDVGVFYREVLGIDPPMMRSDNDQGIWFANPESYGPPGLNSRIAVVSAKSKGAGVGFVIDRLTFSEIGRYEEVCDPRKLMLRINQSLPDTGAKKAKESASYGGNYWRDLWRSNNGSKKIFISWIANEGYRVNLTSEQAGFKLSGSKETTNGDELTSIPLIRAELIRWYPKKFSEDDPRKAMALEIEIKCRLAWRRWCIRKKCNNDWEQFAQQYPLTDEEAFLSAGNYAFPQGKLTAIAENLEAKPYPCKKYNFNKTFDLTTPKWWEEQLIEVDIGGDLYVYEMPRLQFRHVVSVDPSLGIPDRDQGSIRVWRLPENVEVAAYDKSTDPYELADLAYALAMWYGNALIGVEIRGQGYAVIRRLMDSTYYYPNPKPRLFVSKFATGRKDPLYMYGFDTNRSTKKDTMVPDLKKAIEEDAVIFTHPLTVDQLRNYVKDIRGEYSCGKRQDNACISAMIALQLSKNAMDYWERDDYKNEQKKKGYTVTDVVRFMNQSGSGPIV